MLVVSGVAVALSIFRLTFLECALARSGEFNTRGISCIAGIPLPCDIVGVVLAANLVCLFPFFTRDALVPKSISLTASAEALIFALRASTGPPPPPVATALSLPRAPFANDDDLLASAPAPPDGAVPLASAWLV